MLFLFSGAFPAFSAGENVTVKSDSFTYIISPAGKNISFTDNSSGTDLLLKSQESFCSSILSSGKKYDCSSVSMTGNRLLYEF